MAFNVEDVNPNEIDGVRDVVLRIPKELFDKMGIKVIIETPRRSKFLGGKRKAIKFAAKSFLSFKNVVEKIGKKAKDPKKEYEKEAKKIEKEYSKKNDRVEKAYVNKIDEIKDVVSGREDDAQYNYDEVISQLVDELAGLHVALIRISYGRRKKQLENEKMFKMKPDTIENIKNNSYAIFKSKKISATKFEELKKYLLSEKAKGEEAVEVLDRYRDLNNIKESSNLIGDVDLKKSMFDNIAPKAAEEKTAVSVDTEDINKAHVADENISVDVLPDISTVDSGVAVDNDVVAENSENNSKGFNLIDALKQFEIKSSPQSEKSMFDNMASNNEETNSSIRTNIDDADQALNDSTVVDESYPLGQSMFDNLATVNKPEIIPESLSNDDLLSKTIGSEEASSTENVEVIDQHEAIDTYAKMSDTPRPVENAADNDRPQKNDSGVMSVLLAFREEEARKRAIKEEEERKAAQARREAIIKEYKEVMEMMKTVQQKMSDEGINPAGLVEGQVNQESGLSV